MGYHGETRSIHPALRLARARQFADEHYFEALDVVALAEVAGLSRAHFSREFNRAFGSSPHQYLVARRMERAGALLSGTDRAVKDICVCVGFTSVGSFTTRFRRHFGVSPTVYRASARRERNRRVASS